MILSFDRVTYHYPGAETPALDDVSFELEAGEFCLLAGLSGHRQVDAAARGVRAGRRTFTGGASRARCTLAGLTRASTVPRTWEVLRGCCSRTPRRSS